MLGQIGELLLIGVLLDGITNDALEQHGRQRVLRQKIDRPGLHDRQIDFVVVVAGQHHDGAVETASRRTAQYFETGTRPQLIIEQADIVRSTRHLPFSLNMIGRESEGIARPVRRCQ